jgi:hypothetical protein
MEDRATVATRDTPPTRKHRRVAYRVGVTRHFERSRDSDLIDEIYRDSEGDRIGPIFAKGHDLLLILPDESIPLVHVEAALEADHRISDVEPLVVLVYEPDEQPARGVRESGERWESGDARLYAFATDDEALEAQQYTLGV